MRWMRNRNSVVSRILRVCFARQDPPEAYLKRQRGSERATQPAVQDYAAEDICVQKNVTQVRIAEISIS